MSPSIRVEPPMANRPAVPEFALFQLGFRPLYLLASVFAALSVMLWALQFAGKLGHPYLPGPVWHAHELVFGYAAAVIVGFLFTAVRNWTGKPTPTGAPLALLAGVWLAGRVLVWSDAPLAAAIVNPLFLLGGAAGIARPIWAARNKRNYFFVGLLVLMAVAQSLFHLAGLGLWSPPPWASVYVGLDVVLWIMVVMAGRVTPMFTNNAIPEANAQKLPWLESASLGSLLAALLVDRALGAPGERPWWAVALLAAAAGLQLARWWLWHPFRTLRTPLVWILHVAYLWLVVHLWLRVATALGAMGPSLATHALTVGALGSLTLGMMTRTARGHTGRALRADGKDVAVYALITAAAVVRVVLPALWPGQLLGAVQLSGVLWSAAFGLYAVAYWPVLSKPRLDGRPG